MSDDISLVNAFHSRDQSDEDLKAQLAMDEGTLVFNGQAYAVRDFEDRHPGGTKLLRLAYGREATGLIYSYHPDVSKVEAVLRKYRVPMDSVHLLKAEPTPHNLKEHYETPFFKDLHARVTEYFESTGQTRRGGMVTKSLLLLAAVVVMYYVALHVTSWVCPLLGVLVAMIGLCIQHDANHGAFSNSPFLNEVFGALNDVIGASAVVWKHQHTVGHHVHCNDEAADDDTIVGLPMIKFNPSTPLWWHMRFQFLYAPFLYSFMGVISPLNDLIDYWNGTHGRVSMYKMATSDAIQFWSLKVFYVLYMFVYPLYVYDWVLTDFLVYFYLPTLLPGSLYLANLFAVSHNNELCLYNVRDEAWAEMQVLTSANWASTSWFWNVLAGGLNCQIEHHLFPGVAHRHYPHLSPIVRQCCEDHNLPYNDFPTFREIFFSHIRRLYALGRPNCPVEAMAVRREKDE